MVGFNIILSNVHNLPIKFESKKIKNLSKFDCKLNISDFKVVFFYTILICKFIDVINLKKFVLLIY